MDVISAIDSGLLGIVLGITEFLPISSLGHSLVLSAILNFPPDKATRDALAVFIQLGAVLAVLVYYSRDLLKQAQKITTDKETQRFWLNIIIAFIPIGILGLVFNKQIKQYLFSPLIVAIALIVGGIIFLLVEQRKYTPTTQTLEKITFRQALTVGLIQIAALIPGVSRSGSTIIGGILTGLDRSVATAFTFYLFIPTLGAATGYELFSVLKDLKTDATMQSMLPYFLLATAVAFIVALVSIRWLLRYVSTHSFRFFGIYRIVIGIIIIALMIAGLIKTA